MPQSSSDDVAGLPDLALDAVPQRVRASLNSAYAAARARPRDPSAVGRLAMLLHAYEQHQRAAACYRILRSLEPASATWAYLSGAVQAALGEHAAAADAFRDSLRTNPEYLPARLGLAEALMSARELEASGAEYARLAGELGELPLAHYGLGRLAAIRRDSKEAVEHFERAVHVAPQFGPAHYALALAYRDVGMRDRAQPHLDAYRRFGSRRPVVPDPLMDQVRGMRETARDLLSAAAQLERGGRLQESIAMQLKALALDPASAQAHVNLIALYGRTGEPGKAKAHYEAALALEGSRADAHYNYGVLLLSQQRGEEAAAVLRAALEVDPFHAAAHNNVAALFARQGRFVEAAAHYRQALANDPEHATARLNLARVLVLMGRRGEAVDQFTRALARAERAGDAGLAATIQRELRKAGEER